MVDFESTSCHGMEKKEFKPASLISRIALWICLIGIFLLFWYVGNLVL